jgi:hypothetical protein
MRAALTSRDPFRSPPRNIDRTAFLAITASLSVVAAVGCASPSSDDSGTSSEAAISAGGDSLCYSADESTKGSAKGYWMGQIGFDPVNDFPAAEGFCFDMASDGKKTPEGFPAFDEGIYAKCNAYANVYVPHVVYTSYANLKKNLHQKMPIGKKWDVLYSLDRAIAAEDFFCVDSAARLTCRSASDKPSCLRAATQMLPEAKEKLVDCIEKFDVYTCIEGTNRLR